MVLYQIVFKLDCIRQRFKYGAVAPADNVLQTFVLCVAF